MEFIVKDGATNYYLANGSMGCSGEAEGHPSYKYHILEKRGGHEVGSMSISQVNVKDYHPQEVNDVIIKLLAEFKNGKRF